MSKPRTRKPTGRRRITFRLHAPAAEHVAVVGDFNGWNQDLHPMHAKDGGMWEKSVMLTPGSYEYKFFVDGMWWEDPSCDMACDNTFGTRNSVLFVEPKPNPASPRRGR